MKAIKFIISVLCTLCVTAILYAQTIIAQVDYMKIEPGGTSEYLEVEKIWKKIHQARLDQGLITFWGLYDVMFTAENDPYDFVTINWYTSMDKYENSFSNEILKAAFPDMSDEELTKMLERTEASRRLVNTDMYIRQATSETSPTEPAAYFVVNWMTVEPGNASDYLNMEREIYKPVHEESIKGNFRSGWSLWSRFMGNQLQEQYATADAFSSWSQMMQEFSYEEILKKVHPDKNIDELNEMTLKLRTMGRSEVWKLLDSVTSNE